MTFFSRIKSAGTAAPSSDAVGRLSSRESVKKPILLRAHTSGINDLACDLKYICPTFNFSFCSIIKLFSLLTSLNSNFQAKACLDCVQRRQHRCLGRGARKCRRFVHCIIFTFFQPVKIKSVRSATPRIIEAGLGEVLCILYNAASKQFWTSHKASNTIVMWSSTGSKDREIRCACPLA